jgi:hypothetical protein
VLCALRAVQRGVSGAGDGGHLQLHREAIVGWSPDASGWLAGEAIHVQCNQALSPPVECKKIGSTGATKVSTQVRRRAATYSRTSAKSEAAHHGGLAIALSHRPVVSSFKGLAADAAAEIVGRSRHSLRGEERDQPI